MILLKVAQRQVRGASFMLANNPVVTQFRDVLLHTLKYSERHIFNTDSFESEVIDRLYKAFQNYEKNETTENLTALASALKECETNNKELPYNQLNSLIEKMKTTPKRLSP